MSKLLANLVEASREAKAARQAALAASSERKTRSVAANTKKNRLALIAAIQTQNIEALGELIELGAPLSTDHKGDTLLALCAQRHWAEGFDRLLQAGAPTTWRAAGAAPKSARGRAKEQSLFERLAESDFILGVEALWSRATAEEIQAGIGAMSSFEAWESLDKRGLAGQMKLSQATSIAENLLTDCAPAEAPQRAQFLKMQAALGWSATDRRQLWLEAVGYDNPSLTQFAAASGVAPNPDGSVQIAPASLFKSYHYAHRAYHPWMRGASHYDSASTKEGKKERTFSLAELAAAQYRGDENGNLHTLLELPEFIEQLRQSPFALHCLAHSRNSLDLFKALAERGLDLSAIVDSHGRNPLHHALDGGQARTKIELLAAVCEPWIHQRDDQGLQPLELSTGATKAALGVVFDKIGMRAALGGKRGSRNKGPARRL